VEYLKQPDIDPVIFRLWGPLQVRWYSVLYVGGFVVARFILKKLAREQRFQFTGEDIEQYILWILVGAVAGARLFYCVVYDPMVFFSNPLYLFQVYNGGLSFHGGFLGVIVSGIIFCRRKGIPFWNLCDAVCLATPPGLAMGRIGNFINGELWGRVTDVPWAIIFKNGGPFPRHPSQLYECFLEGFVLFGVLWGLKNKLTRDGQLSMIFFMGYAAIRFTVEFFREPDAHLGYLLFGLSMGQLLSVLMFVISGLVGYFLFWRRQAANHD
jgi:phosphatidylglycerol---prolipoprotein diacylglyceryl transferase